MSFSLQSSFLPTGDQPQAIEKLLSGIKANFPSQVLLGVTGSGKTYTMAQVIEKTKRPTLIISHNKTLAAQLYQEFRDFFPKNAVSYFVSYYDFYQPEAFITSSNTYIEKEADINETIDKLRMQAVSNILWRKDVVVVASVSCIYNIGRPEDYQEYALEVKVGDFLKRKSFFQKLVTMQYSQSQFDFKRSTFRDRGDYLDVYLSGEDVALRIEIQNEKITKLSLIDPLTAKKVEEKTQTVIFPAKLYLVGNHNQEAILKTIQSDLKEEVGVLKSQKKLVEAQRLQQRVNHDLEMIKEVGYVNGIENYSRYFDGRKPGDAPSSLLDYFNYAYQKQWLLMIDESHMTLPQIRGMYHGDQSRKQNLVDYGFRLKAAFDNRPLKYDEFEKRIPQTIYVSATPDEFELNQASQIVEQLVRPTAIADPIIEIRPVKNQVLDLIAEIEKRVAKKERILVTTLTKRIAEDLASYLKDKGIRAQYLHSDIKTLERSDILDSLREGKFDVLIGINLLREGLDLPEVTLVAILDADKEGFLRSRTALIQTMGRAARNAEGRVLIYTDKTTRSINLAIEEVQRRRKYQLEYNEKHGLTPHTIHKPIRERLVIESESDFKLYFANTRNRLEEKNLAGLNKETLTPYDRKKILSRLKTQMRHEAENLNFEFAAVLRDKIKELDS